MRASVLLVDWTYLPVLWVMDQQRPVGAGHKYLLWAEFQREHLTGVLCQAIQCWALLHIRESESVCVCVCVCVCTHAHASFCSVGRIGKRSPKWRWLQDKEGQRKVRGPEWRLQAEQTALLAKPNLHRAGPDGGKNIKEGAKALSHGFSLLRACTRACSLSLSCYLLNKIEL